MSEKIKKQKNKLKYEQLPKVKEKLKDLEEADSKLLPHIYRFFKFKNFIALRFKIVLIFLIASLLAIGYYKLYNIINIKESNIYFILASFAIALIYIFTLKDILSFVVSKLFIEKKRGSTHDLK